MSCPVSAGRLPAVLDGVLPMGLVWLRLTGKAAVLYGCLCCSGLRRPCGLASPLRGAWNRAFVLDLRRMRARGVLPQAHYRL